MPGPRKMSRPRAELRSSSWGSLGGGLFGFYPHVHRGLERGELRSSELERVVGGAARIGSEVEPALIGGLEVDSRPDLVADEQDVGVGGRRDLAQVHRPGRAGVAAC